MTPVIVQIGNQTAPHATEAAYRDGYEAAGCLVGGIEQAKAFEMGPARFLAEVMQPPFDEPDLVIYSRTHNNTALGAEWTEAWRTLEARGTKTASVHLDVFWGLPEREQWIAEGDPLFTTGLVLTADGGSDDKWAAAGVNHRWLPPGADTRYVHYVEPFAELAGKVVFVGSSLGYHPLYPGRMKLIEWARAHYGDRFIEIGNGTVWGPRRGEELARIYASDCYAIGDSCFAGTRARYWSDRVPETLARYGLLFHPTIEGMDALYEPGDDYLPWTVGDFDTLAEQIDDAEGWGETYRRKIRSNGHFVVSQRDTYRHRAKEILGWLGIPGGVLSADRAVFPRSEPEAAEGFGES